jgi:hypothetical protein
LGPEQKQPVPGGRIGLDAVGRLGVLAPSNGVQRPGVGDRLGVLEVGEMESPALVFQFASTTIRWGGPTSVVPLAPWPRATSRYHVIAPR